MPFRRFGRFGTVLIVIHMRSVFAWLRMCNVNTASPIKYQHVHVNYVSIGVRRHAACSHVQTFQLAPWCLQVHNNSTEVLADIRVICSCCVAGGNLIRRCTSPGPQNEGEMSNFTGLRTLGGSRKRGGGGAQVTASRQVC